MVLQYQVSVKFIFFKSKPQLHRVYLKSIHSTWDNLLIYPAPNKPLAYSRKFYTLEQAQKYITYLFKKYPKSSAPLPVLDSGQQKLFKELEK